MLGIERGHLRRRILTPAVMSTPPASASRFAPTRFGWALLAACCSVNVFSRGLGDSFVVFLLPLSESFNWSRASATGIYGLALMTTGLSGILVGAMVDRFGPRPVLSLGLTLLCAAFISAPYLDSLLQFQLALGLSAGFGVACSGNVVHAGLVGRWFGGRMGMATGLMFGAPALGVLVMIPLAQALVEAYGWREAYHLLALMLIPAALVVLLFPWGRALSRPASSRPISSDGAATWTFARAIRTRAFWALFGVYFFTSVSMYGLTTQTVAYLIEVGFAPLTAASAFGANALVATLGMFGFGILSDRLGQRRMGEITFWLTASGMALLWILGHHPSLWLLYAYVLVFGAGQGSRGPIITALTSRLFAGGSLGRIYGGITAGFGFGAGVGSWAGGALHDWTGGYDWVFAFSVVVIMMGWLCMRALPRHVQD
jgi:MFS family permease